jgi:hypothetical protein
MSRDARPASEPVGPGVDEGFEAGENIEFVFMTVVCELPRARSALARSTDSSKPGLDDLGRALLSAYIAAWGHADIDRLVSVARSDAARTTLIRRLRPVGAGWVRLPVTGGAGPSQPAFRPAFMDH